MTKDRYRPFSWIIAVVIFAVVGLVVNQALIREVDPGEGVQLPEVDWVEAEVQQRSGERIEKVELDAVQPESADPPATADQIRVVVSVDSADSGVKVPAKGALVWMAPWVDAHIQVPAYATKANAAVQLNREGEALFTLAMHEKASLVVEYFGQRRRVQLTPEARPKDGVIRLAFDPPASVDLPPV